ncbi:MAG: hypothetical protein FJY65_09460 [Calditrichaeota bacterium]|nr:hypothetical protein [Calditrichota bacterium]
MFYSKPNINPFVVLLLPVALLGLLSGCDIGGAGSFIQGETPEQNNARAVGKPVTGDWLVVNMLDEPEHLNPQTSTSASAQYIDNYIYEAFLQTRREPPWDEIPLLADGMPVISDDHLVYTWKLRKDAKWHDGHPITMCDAEFSLKSLMNPYVDDLPSKPYYADLDSLLVPDEWTMVMFCTQAYFMHLQFLGGFSIIPKHIFDPRGLMDDITYTQVKYGAAYGRIADFLESGENIDTDDLVPAVALYGLQKSIDQVSESKVSWREIEKAIPAESAPLRMRLESALKYLSENPHGAAGLRFANEIQTSTLRAFAALGCCNPKSKIQNPKFYRDLHTRIETYGREFNSHEQNRAPTVGSGPFKFDYWRTGQELVLARNKDYWLGEGYAYLDKLVFRVLTDYTASLVALKNGTIDFFENMQTIQYLTMTNQKKFINKYIKSTYIIPTYSYIGWRNSHPIFKDPIVRNAMTRMVRREEIAKKIQFGFSEVIESPFYRFGFDIDTSLKRIAFDPIEAQKLLKSAGWEDVDNDGILEKDTLEFKFEILIPSGIPLAEQTVSIMREDLATIGIIMDIRRLEWSVFINNYIRNHKFDACYLGWAMGIRQDPKQIWHTSSATGRGSNHIEYRNARADSLIDAARTEFDPVKRRELYIKFQKLLYAEQPYTFMFSSKLKPAYDKRFKGVKWYPFRPGYQLDEWWALKEEQKYK